MSKICTAAEIAEKRRIAQERLKQKSVQKSTVTAINTNGSKPSTNPTTSFYNKQLPNVNIPNPIPKSFNKPIPTEQNSYKKFISAFPKQVPNNSKILAPPVQNNYPVFTTKNICEVTVVSETSFVVKPSKYHEQLINVFKTIPSKHYDANTRFWTFNISDYELLHEHAINLKSEVQLTHIPKQILDLLRKPNEEFDFSYLPSIEPKLTKSLMEFQKEGVSYGIAKHGRVMIADEMGLGKTLQALAIADYFREEWPLLISTTASTRNCWFNHIKDYLPSVRVHNVVTLNSADFHIYDSKIVITSYSLMEKHVDKLLEHNFGVLIFDESHCLKSFDAKRTKNAEKLAKNARRIILLSGTPALSKPVELYCQMKMIDKNFLSFKAFSERYCDGKQTNFGWDSSGQSNLTELNVILKKKFMIRRLKSEVLSQLAEKNRETVKLNPDLIKLNEETQKNFNEFERKLTQGNNHSHSKEILLTYYAKTAEIKSKAVCDYLKSLIKEQKKFIVFAHHKTMMNSISSFLYAKKIDFIRIDGSTKPDLRDEFVKRFQSKEPCKVAVLSLHACNAGITLTAADLVIFAELDWNPSTLAQAEGRAHRIGQQNTVTCRYLLAENTADTIIWKMLKEKQDVLNNAGLFSENLQNAQHSLAPTKNENIEKYFTPTKRKIENFYGTNLKTSDNGKEINEIKKVKLCDQIENINNINLSPSNNSSSSTKISNNNSNDIPNSSNNHLKDKVVPITEVNNKSVQPNKSEYDDLFNELDDAEIPRTPAIFRDNTKNPSKNEYEDIFNEMSDADFVDLAF